VEKNPMIPVKLTVDILARAKETCRAGLPSKSGHLDEALAAGFGRRTRAALLPDLVGGCSVDSIFDPATFAARLAELDPTTDPAFSRLLGVQAVCSGFTDCDATAMAGNVRDALAGIATVALWRAVYFLCQSDWKLLPEVVALSPVIEPDARCLRLDGSTLRFPIDLGTRDRSSVQHSIKRACDIVRDERQELTLVPPSATARNAPARLRRYGFRLDTAEGIRSAIAAFSLDPDGFGDAEGLSVGSFLAKAAYELEYPSRDHVLRDAVHRAAAKRLTEHAAVAVQSEAWKGSMFPSTNSKIFMSVGGDWERSIDVRGGVSDHLSFKCLPEGMRAA
jgi:hypothetical protein